MIPATVSGQVESEFYRPVSLWTVSDRSHRSPHRCCCSILRLNWKTGKTVGTWDGEGSPHPHPLELNEASHKMKSKNSGTRNTICCEGSRHTDTVPFKYGYFMGKQLWTRLKAQTYIIWPHSFPFSGALINKTLPLPNFLLPCVLALDLIKCNLGNVGKSYLGCHKLLRKLRSFLRTLSFSNRS